MTNEPDIALVELATGLTVAWLGNANNRVAAEDVPNFLHRMHETVISLAAGGRANSELDPPSKRYIPAVSARKSLASPDHIVSMIDGKAYKTLRRHLTTHGMTPDEYRERYGLKKDYPMVAPTYSVARQQMARKIGLGRKPGQTVAIRSAAKSVKAKVREGKAVAQARLGGADQ